MRRAYAILAILALLAAPWALVARSFAAGVDGCDGYCCLPHGSHARHPQNSSPQAADADMQCHHREAGHMLHCSMRSGQQGLAFGLLSPLAPTSPSVSQRIVTPETSRRHFFGSTFDLTAGYSAAPFEPPRS
jgi:hypothetical protein